jgi:hypothetical protein
LTDIGALMTGIQCTARAFQADSGEAMVSLSLVHPSLPREMGIALSPEMARELASQLELQARRAEELKTV